MPSTTRRRFLALGAASTATLGAAAQIVPHEAGEVREKYGERSPFEHSLRFLNPGPYGGIGSARTPLEALYGIITPSSLFFERLHAGVPSISPERHTLLIDGLVDRPIVLSLSELKRLPSVSRIHFIECAGNSSAEHAGEPRDTPQKSHGLVSCAEWTGVRLSTLLEMAGVKANGKWVYAEGADACRLARSLPLEKPLMT